VRTYDIVRLQSSIVQVRHYHPLSLLKIFNQGENVKQWAADKHSMLKQLF
jgi:hypothetical protein